VEGTSFGALHFFVEYDEALNTKRPPSL